MFTAVARNAIYAGNFMTQNGPLYTPATNSATQAAAARSDRPRNSERCREHPALIAEVRVIARAVNGRPN